MAVIRNYNWDQGADGEVSIVYKEGPTRESVQPVDLTGYQVRMDIRSKSGDHIWTFNSNDIVETPSIDEPGNADNEATLGPNGEIFIVVVREVTLPGGPAENIKKLDYDIFLRNPAGRQKKIQKGEITINPSVTHWA